MSGAPQPTEQSARPADLPACRYPCPVEVAALVTAEAEVRRLTAELERCERDLRHFAHVTSHDLAEPLRVMSGYAEMLGRRYDDRLDDRAKRYIGNITDGAGHMHSLIEALLAYSRARSRPLALGEVDLGTLLVDALADLAPELVACDAVITRDALPTLIVDPDRVREVLHELIANAIKFSDEPPRVHIGAHDRGGWWELSVSDGGIGIEPRLQQRVFELLQRLHPRERYAGTGTGLALCRDSVNAHGGEIWVESTPGCGSSFRFTLPESAPATAAEGGLTA